MSSRVPRKETVTLGPAVRDGEHAYGIVHISGSFNGTLINVTDLSGRESLVRVSCCTEYPARLAVVRDVARRCKELGITAMHVKLRPTCGNKTTVSSGARSALKTLALCGTRISRIEYVTLIPTNSTRREIGRTGRRRL